MKEFEQSLEAQTAKFMVNSLREKMPEQMVDLNNALIGSDDPLNFVRQLAISLGLPEVQIKKLNPNTLSNELTSHFGHAVAQNTVLAGLKR